MFTQSLLHSGGVKAKTPQDTYKLVTDFKTQLKARIKHMEKQPLPLTHFPDDPMQLPKKVYDAVFGEENPSPPSKTASAGENACTVVARKSHNSVKKSLGFDENLGATMMNQMHQMMMGNSMMDNMNPMAMMLAGFQAMMTGQGISGSNPNLQIFGPRKRNEKKALAGAANAGVDRQQLTNGQQASAQKALTDGFAESLPDSTAETEDNDNEELDEPKDGTLFELPAPESMAPAQTNKPPSHYAEQFAATMKAREKQKDNEKKENYMKRPASAATPSKAKKPKAGPASSAHGDPAASNAEDADTSAKDKSKTAAKAKAEGSQKKQKPAIAPKAEAKAKASAKASAKAKAKAVNLPPGKFVGCGKCRNSREWGCAQCRKRAGMWLDEETMEWNWPE